MSKYQNLKEISKSIGFIDFKAEGERLGINGACIQRYFAKARRDTGLKIDKVVIPGLDTAWLSKWNSMRAKLVHVDGRGALIRLENIPEDLDKVLENGMHIELSSYSTKGTGVGAVVETAAIGIVIHEPSTKVIYKAPAEQTEGETSAQPEPQNKEVAVEPEVKASDSDKWAEEKMEELRDAGINRESLLQDKPASVDAEVPLDIQDFVMQSMNATITNTVRKLPPAAAISSIAHKNKSTISTFIKEVFDRIVRSLRGAITEQMTFTIARTNVNGHPIAEVIKSDEDWNLLYDAIFTTISLIIQQTDYPIAYVRRKADGSAITVHIGIK